MDSTYVVHNVTSTSSTFKYHNHFERLELLEFVNFRENDIPVIVYLIVLSIIGTIGNTHALLVYFLRYKASNYRTFVLSLACVDLVASTLSLPFETFDIRFPLTFSNGGLCKIFRGLNYFVGICSGLLLGVIAIERFRKVCRPMGRQLSLKEAKIACVVTIVVAFGLCLPSVFMYGLAETPVNGSVINGTECTVLNEVKNTFVFQAFNVACLFLSTAVFIICIVLYSFIGKVLYRQMKFRRTSNTQYHRNSNGSNPERNGRPMSHIHEDESSFGNDFRKFQPVTALVTPDATSTNSNAKRSRFSRSKQITFMFLIATAVSYFWYLPHLCLTIVKSLSKSKYATIELELGAVTDILVRTYFVSNVTNPIVYCLLDKRFRTQCRHMYRNLFRRLTCSEEKYYV